MNKQKLTAIVITNEAEKLQGCLNSIKWANEIVVVDSSKGKEVKRIAKKFNARVIGYSKGSFQDWRNKGLKEAQNGWILYVDADERVTGKLKREIKKTITIGTKQVAFAIPRKNYILGREMKYGGEWPDYQIRLFRKVKLKRWRGKLHEQPDYDGELGHLSKPLIHKKHEYLSEMVEKTNMWSDIEAELLFKSGHPKMTWWRFFRVMITELSERLIFKLGFLDGTKGVIYSIYQMWSKFVTYAKLWELQIRSSRQ